jgi:ankyrin repeat protein
MNFSRACEIENLTELKARLKGKTPEVRKELASSGISSAVRCNSLDVVKMLLKNGAKIKKDCIANAAGNADYPEVLKYFLESGICYSSRDGKNALYYASSAGIVNILVKNGFFVNSSDKDGNTPLLYTVKRSMYKNHWRRSEIVEALIKNGADVKIKDQNGNTPLLRGFSSRYSMPDFNTVKVLLENGADVNSQNRQGQTALQFAVKRGDCRLVDLLLKHGANPWQAENYFNTTYPYIRRQLKKAMSSTKYSRKSYVPRKIIHPANTAPAI